MLNYDLFFGNCLKKMQEMVDKGERVNAILTDPPYLYLNHKLDRSFDERLFFELSSKLTDKILFFGRGDSFYKWNILCAEFGFEFKEEIVWDKKCISNPMCALGRRHELISVRMKKGRTINKVKIDYEKYIIENRDFERLWQDINRIKSSILNGELLDFLEKGELKINKCKIKHGISRGGGNEISRGIRCYKSMIDGALLSSIITENREHYKMEHPTQKPINLLRKLVLLISDKGDLIFDPFMGSGSTGVACAIEGRKFLGCEIDKEYFEIAERRIGETTSTLKQSLFYGID